MKMTLKFLTCREKKSEGNLRGQALRNPTISWAGIAIIVTMGLFGGLH